MVSEIHYRDREIKLEEEGEKGPNWATDRETETESSPRGQVEDPFKERELEGVGPRAELEGWAPGH